MKNKVTVLEEWELFCLGNFTDVQITKSDYARAETAFYSGFASCLRVVEKFSQLPDRIKKELMEGLRLQAMRQPMKSEPAADPVRVPEYKPTYSSDPSEMEMLQED